jgi:hypothetical protein
MSLLDSLLEGVGSTGPGNIVEDCILKKYGTNNAREVTCLAVGADGDVEGQQQYCITDATDIRGITNDVEDGLAGV